MEQADNLSRVSWLGCGGAAPGIRLSNIPGVLLLLAEDSPMPHGVRVIGASVSSLAPVGESASLFHWLFSRQLLAQYEGV